MKTLFLPTWLDGLPRNAPSARIRAEWVAKYWDGAEVYDGTQSATEYEVLVFQKCYLTATAQRFAQYGDVRVADICDPEFLDPRKVTRLHAHLDRMDAVVVPTEPLAEWFRRWLPTCVIPDRLDLEAHELRTGDEEPYFPGEVGLVWLGGWQNYATLETMLPIITTAGLPLVTIADQLYPGLPFVRWEGVEQANEWIKRFDILLNPQPPGSPWKYKSNNKTLTAWACGVPVAHDVRELYELLDLTPEERFALGQERRREVEERWDVRLSVEQWKRVLEEVR